MFESWEKVQALTFKEAADIIFMQFKKPRYNNGPCSGDGVRLTNILFVIIFHFKRINKNYINRKSVLFLFKDSKIPKTITSANNLNV